MQFLSALLLASLPSAFAGFTPNVKTNIALYWGQNSNGQSTGNLAQQRLLTYCKNANVDIVPVSFLTQMTSGQGGQPVLNFANQQNGCSVFAGTQLVRCPQVARDIVACQRDHGKTILLSIGGATYSEGGFASNAIAEAWATKLWAMFGPRQAGSKELRPFNNAVVDGFDIDIETASQNTVAFARRLRALMDAARTKKFYLTAAPQCPYPDAAVGEMISAVGFDAIFIQFYNNFCGLQSFVRGSATQSTFNYQTWDNWAKQVSPNRNVRIFLGVPGGPGGAGSGWSTPQQLTPIINYCKTFTSFAGVMVWDASQAYTQRGFLAAVKRTLTAR